MKIKNKSGKLKSLSTNAKMKAFENSDMDQKADKMQMKKMKNK